MGELTDKAKGAANEAIGKTKSAVGDATDRPDIRAEGDAQQATGGLQKIKGSIKEAAGKLTGDRRTEAEGKTDRAKGQVKDVAHDVKESVKGVADSLSSENRSHRN